MATKPQTTTPNRAPTANTPTVAPETKVEAEVESWIALRDEHGHSTFASRLAGDR